MLSLHPTRLRLTDKPIVAVQATIKCLGLFISITSASAFAAHDLKQTLDWVPHSQLTKEQKAQLPAGSCGAYISPIVVPDTETDPTPTATKTSSNQTQIIEKDGFKDITLIGDVVVKQGYQTLTADQAMYSELTGIITLDGNITVRQPNLFLLADRGRINQQLDQLEAEKPVYVIHSANVRGDGQHVLMEKDIIHIKDGHYTSCKPDNNSWTLKGSTITIDTEKNQGEASHVRLIIKGIPVFYWPYLRFALDHEKKSGFLFPSLSLDDGSANMSVPFYFNLAPHYDLLFTSHLLQDHGVLFEANARHLSRHFETDINLSHLSNDSGGLSDSETELIANGTYTVEQVVPFAGTDRWSIGIHQTGGKNKPWFSTIDYNEISDYDYLEDFHASIIKTNNTVSLNQQITAGYQFNHWRLTVNTQQYQTLNNHFARPYKLLPQINFDGEYFMGDWKSTLKNEWIRFDHSDADDTAKAILTGNRAHLKYGIGINKDWRAGFLRPTVQLQHLRYQLDASNLNTGANVKPSITVPQAIIDAGLYFDRDGSGYQQTFEPRLYYFYSAHKDQTDLTGTGHNINFDTSLRTFNYRQLFTDSRFSGSDRIDDANQLSIGLTTRFMDTQSGRELLSINIGQALYFEEPQVSVSGTADTENHSPIAALITANMTENWTLSNDTIYDNDHHTQISTSALKYRDDHGGLMNLSHRYVRDRSEQVELSVIFPAFDNHWYMMGHYHYDVKNQRDLEHVFGFEYHNCCYKARFAYTRFIDNSPLINYDEAVIFELQFLGLGETGDRFTRTLGHAIDGYKQWQTIYSE